ncbi:MAG: glycosyltransferase family 2 protein [Betaproteobacteria bacterium]
MTSKALTVSAVLCTYNGERYLPDLLASLRSQSRPLDQLIVSDDASTDGTVALLEAELPRFKCATVLLRSGHNVGAAANFSASLGQATGDVVLPCDQDDLWQPSKVERLADVLEGTSSAVVFHNAQCISANGRPTGQLLADLLDKAPLPRGPDAFRRLLRRNLVSGCTMALRRKFLLNALPVPAGFMHDEWLALMAAARDEIVFVDEPLISYRLHGGNALGLRDIGARAAVTQRLGDVGGQRARKIARLEGLNERLSQRREGMRPEALDYLNEAIGHLKSRQGLPQAMVGRIPIVMREWRAGRYRRHSGGVLSALRDALRGSA